MAVLLVYGIDIKVLDPTLKIALEPGGTPVLI